MNGWKMKLPLKYFEVEVAGLVEKMQAVINDTELEDDFKQRLREEAKRIATSILTPTYKARLSRFVDAEVRRAYTHQIEDVEVKRLQEGIAQIRNEMLVKYRERAREALDAVEVPTVQDLIKATVIATMNEHFRVGAGKSVPFHKYMEQAFENYMKEKEGG